MKKCSGCKEVSDILGILGYFALTLALMAVVYGVYCKAYDDSNRAACYYGYKVTTSVQFYDKCRGIK